MTDHRLVPLSPAERRVLEGVREGRPVDLGGRRADADGPRRPEEVVRGAVVAAILAGELSPARPPTTARRRELSLRGAILTGPLDLTGVTAPYGIRFADCEIEGDLLLAEATVPGLRLNRCRLQHLRGVDLRVDGALQVEHCVVASMVITDAHVTGRTSLDDTTIVNAAREPRCLHADGATFGSDLSAERLRANGEINLFDAEIVGQLDLSDATLRNADADGYVLRADRATIKAGLIATALRTSGELCLRGATIGGLDLSGATLADPSGVALSADLARIDGDFVAIGLRSTGELRLPAVTMSGQLDLSDATLANPGGNVLQADQALFGGGMLATDTTASGEIRLLGATLRGQLDLADAVLDNPGRHALCVDQVTIDGDLTATGITMTGEFRMIGATVRGQLDLSDATLRNPGSGVLTGDQASLDGGLFATDLRTSGEISLAAVTVNGVLDLEGATLENSGATALRFNGSTAKNIFLRRLTWSGTISLARMSAEALSITGVTALDETSSLRLAHAQINTIECDHWTDGPRLHVDGLRYTRLDPQPTPAQWAGWLARSQGRSKHDPDAYVPSAYDALATSLHDAGREDDARRVRIAKHDRRRRYGDLDPWSRAAECVYHVLVGYGFAPIRLFPTFGALVLLSLLVSVVVAGDDSAWRRTAAASAACRVATPVQPPAAAAQTTPRPSGAPTTTGGAAGAALSASTACPAPSTASSSRDLDGLDRVVFAFDAAVPVVDLGQERRFEVRGPWLRTWYVLTVLGSWLLGIMLVAAIGRRLVRD